jgi:hypothetical protein
LLSVFMLNVVMLSVIRLSIVMQRHCLLAWGGGECFGGLFNYHF